MLSLLLLMLNNRFYAVDKLLFEHFGKSEYDLCFDADVQQRAQLMFQPRECRTTCTASHPKRGKRGSYVCM